MCHRPGGVAADFDARHDTPLRSSRTDRRPIPDQPGRRRGQDRRAHDPWRSTLLTRVETLEATKMPPLAHEVVDRGRSRSFENGSAACPGLK